MISMASLVKLSSVSKGYKGPLLSFIERVSRFHLGTWYQGGQAQLMFQQKREDRRRVLAKEASSSLQDELMFGEQASGTFG
jgi:hypothetical protein